MSTLLPNLSPGRLLSVFSRATPYPVGVEAGETWLRFAQWHPSPGHPSPPESASATSWRFTALDELHTGDAPLTDLGKVHRNRLQAAGLQGRQVLCAISSPAVEIFPVSFHPKGSDTLESLVILNARERLSYPLEKAVLDYAILPEEVKRAGEDAVSVLIFSAPRVLVEIALTRLESLGLEAARIMTPGCVLAPRIKGDPEARHLVVNAGEIASSIAVVQNGAVLLERILPWGLQSLLMHIQAELDLTETQARQLLDEFAADASPRKTLHRTLESIILSPFQELAHEAASCLGYCDSYLQHRVAASCVVLGTLATQPTLRSVIENRLGLPVVSADEGCSLPEWYAPPDGGCYALAACASLWREEDAA